MEAFELRPLSGRSRPSENGFSWEVEEGPSGLGCLGHQSACSSGPVGAFRD